MNPGERLALDAHLKTLRLPSVKRDYAKTAVDAVNEGVSHERYLLRLLEMELADRDARAFAKRLKDARLPSKKTLAEFEFAAIPALVRILAKADTVGGNKRTLLALQSGHSWRK